MSVEMRFTKWGGKRHWHYPLEPLGSDEHGWWLGGRAGSVLRRGFEPPVLQPDDYVLLVPDEGDWIGTWSSTGRSEIYVDVTTRPVRRENVIEAVDLDLDVVRRRKDGRVVVLDEDEFEEHQVLLGYPPEVIAKALATTEELVALVTARTEPFGEIGAAWLSEFANTASAAKPSAPRASTAQATAARATAPKASAARASAARASAARATAPKEGGALEESAAD
jgi:uncharacterized protein